MNMREFALSVAVRPQPVAVAVAIDEEEFRVLYEETARPLLAYLTRASGNAETARDLLQEAYFHLLRAPRLPAESVVRRKYLFRVASNLLRDYWRRAKREGRAIGEQAAEAAAGDAGFASDVRGALSQLRPRDRQMLWLAYVEEYDHREIAAAMGLRHASIRMLLFRARHKLAGLLRPAELAGTGKRG